MVKFVMRREGNNTFFPDLQGGSQQDWYDHLVGFSFFFCLFGLPLLT